MESKVTVDQAGRVLLPKALREELHLTSGDVLSVRTDGREIVLKREPSKALLKKEQGVWVYQGLAATSVTGVIDRERERRLRELQGTE